MADIISSHTCSSEHKSSLVIYGFKDWTGRNEPKANSNSSSDNSLNDLIRESSSSIRTGSELILIGSSIIGQVD